MSTGDGIHLGVGIVLAVTMVGVWWYAWEARKQAKASLKMTQEMRHQRLISVQPIVVPLALVVSDRDIEAVVANVGNGPSFDLSFCLQSLETGKEVDEGSGAQVLRPGEQMPIRFRPKEVFEEKRQRDTGQTSRVFPPGQYKLVASCHDLYGNRLSVIRPFEVRETAAELQAHLGYMRFSGYDVQPTGEAGDDPRSYR